MTAKKTSTEGALVLAFPAPVQPVRRRRKASSTPAPVYRVERDQVPQRWIDALIKGDADKPDLSTDGFGVVVRCLVALRIDAFDLPFDTFTGGTCSLVRKAMQGAKPSELARAVRGAGKDRWQRQRKPTLAQIFADVPKFIAYDGGTSERTRDVVVAEYIRLHPVVDAFDWTTPRPTIDEAGRTSLPVLEQHLVDMKTKIAARKK